jgi:hypothetical protein
MDKMDKKLSIMALKVFTDRLTNSSKWINGKTSELLDREVTHLVNDEVRDYGENQPEQGLLLAFHTAKIEFKKIEDLLKEIGIL